MLPILPMDVEIAAKPAIFAYTSTCDFTQGIYYVNSSDYAEAG
jgi:hypothetical protein